MHAVVLSLVVDVSLDLILLVPPVSCLFAVVALGMCTHPPLRFVCMAISVNVIFPTTRRRRGRRLAQVSVGDFVHVFFSGNQRVAREGFQVAVLKKLKVIH